MRLHDIEMGDALVLRSISITVQGEDTQPVLIQGMPFVCGQVREIFTCCCGRGHSEVREGNEPRRHKCAVGAPT